MYSYGSSALVLQYSAFMYCLDDRSHEESERHSIKIGTGSTAAYPQKNQFFYGR